MNIATVTASSSATATAASSYSFLIRLIGAHKSLMERTAETALSCVSVLYFFSLCVYSFLIRFHLGFIVVFFVHLGKIIFDRTALI